MDHARQWCARFVRWHNDEHKHSSIEFVTPTERHRGDDVKLLAKRDELYRQARAANPSRWSSGTRNWERADSMTLNPNKTAGLLENVA